MAQSRPFRADPSRELPQDDVVNDGPADIFIPDNLLMHIASFVSLDPIQAFVLKRGRVEEIKIQTATEFYQWKKFLAQNPGFARHHVRKLSIYYKDELSCSADSDLLQYVPHLKELYVWRCGDICAKRLSLGLKQVPRLTKLVLRSNGIGRHDAIRAKHISNALKHVPHLTTLELWDNDGIRDVSAEHISNALKHVPHLTTLRLHGDYSSLCIGRIGAIGAAHIFNALKYVPHLTTLDLA